MRSLSALLVLLVVVEPHLSSWGVLSLTIEKLVPTPTRRTQTRASKEECLDEKNDNVMDDDAARRNSLILALVDQARTLGPVANDQPDDVKEAFLEHARELQPLSDPQPARVDFTGVHERLYSVSPGKKYGHIQQIFTNATNFVNSVSFLGGILQTTVDATYVAKDDVTTVITFNDELCFSLFGRIVARKQLPKSEGYWHILFVGTFVDHDGREKRVRIMETPSLFLLLQTM